MSTGMALTLGSVMALAACEDTTGPVGIEGSITVLITAEGENVDGATVRLTGASIQESMTPSGGIATFDDLMGGAYTVSLSGIPGDYAFGSTSRSVNLTTNQPDATVSFPGSIVRTASISGQVTADGVGVEGVSVEISGGGDGATEDRQTDAGGGYAFTGLRAGGYTATISGFDPNQYEFPSTQANVSLPTGDSEVVNFSGTQGNSRENPASPGESVTVETDGFISGEATIQLTYLRYVRGDAALDSVLAANQFNDEPPPGYEYLLARFRVEVVEVAGTEAFEMWDGDWEAFSASGVLYPEAYRDACCLPASLEGEGFAGASWEGWVPFYVQVGDGNPTAVFQREGSGETWFALLE